MRTPHRAFVRPRRAHVTVPAALIGTLAATFAAVPADAAGLSSPREARPPQPVTATPPVLPPHSRATTTHVAVTHTVASGESVWSIARSHGLLPADVLRWNGLDWSTIVHPGQVLTLSATGTTGSAPVPSATPPAHVLHTVVAGETLSGIAQHHGTPLRSLFDSNGLDGGSVIYPGQVISIPGATAAAAITPPATSAAPVNSFATHTVARGDTLTGIAQRHGVSLGAVLAANALGTGSIIYPGQDIVVPTGSTTAGEPIIAERDGLDAEQMANARLIVQIGRESAVPDRGIAIALATAMVESWIRNLDGGDRDSLGLYQQRPSMGWGTPAEIRDPSRAIRVFYGGPNDPNGSHTRGLLDVAGWEQMGFAEAAQAVQRSAFPDRYAAWEGPAYRWIAALG